MSRNKRETIDRKADTRPKDAVQPSENSDRRRFLVGTAAVAAGVATVVTSSVPSPAIASGVRRWNMVSTFPKGSPGLERSGSRIARTIETLSEGKIVIENYGAGELVPAFETFDAVRENQAQLGNSMPYFWTGRDRRAGFFSSVPNGLTADEQMAWLYHGEGQALWDELYAEYGLKGFMAGTFGSQQVGWFKNPINSVDDLSGIRMRIPGLAGDVMERLGVNTVQLPLGEVISAIQSGTIDAAEFLGGWADLAFGFPRVADYLYGPGWHEPGASAELMINLSEWEDLSDHLKACVEHAARSETAYHTGLFVHEDAIALQTIVDEHNVNVQPFPDDVLTAMFEAAEEVTREIGDQDDLARRIFSEWDKLRQSRVRFGSVQAKGYLDWRSRTLGRG